MDDCMRGQHTYMQFVSLDKNIPDELTPEEWHTLIVSGQRYLRMAYLRNNTLCK